MQLELSHFKQSDFLLSTRIRKHHRRNLKRKIDGRNSRRTTSDVELCFSLTVNWTIWAVQNCFVFYCISQYCSSRIFRNICDFIRIFYVPRAPVSVHIWYETNLYTYLNGKMKTTENVDGFFFYINLESTDKLNISATENLMLPSHVSRTIVIDSINLITLNENCDYANLFLKYFLLVQNLPS